MTQEPIAVIGIGPEGAADLSAASLDHIRRAEVLAGGRRHHEYFPDHQGERIVLDGDIGQRLQETAVKARTRKTVVLASGDPLYYGIGKALLEVFAKDELIFFPHLSSVQLAFARLKETWHDACVVSLHGRPVYSLLAPLRRGEPKIAVLTDAVNDPHAICRLVDEAGCADDYVAWVCENLGGVDERLTQLSLRQPADTPFSALNVVVLVRWGTTAPGANLPALLGIPEDALAPRAAQGRGPLEPASASSATTRKPRRLITKREVRLLSLCHLELRPDDVLWDIGAGTGSVSIEAARLSPRLLVHAVERNPARCSWLKENVESFGLTNVHGLVGEAPEALARLPDPDAIFIGGSAGRLRDILAAAIPRLRRGGRLVINCIALETLNRGWTWLSEQGLEPELISVQVARSRPLGSLHCLEPEHPISILKARKP
jgi:precorrin-6Y C5,15-methyltransferase (decarboxylating)